MFSLKQKQKQNQKEINIDKLMNWANEVQMRNEFENEINDK